jgi:hypothetical protein
MVHLHKILTLILILAGACFVVCGRWWTGSIQNFHDSLKLLRSLETLWQAAWFAKWQEASRKDIERVFGVLKAKFHFLLTRIELWHIGEITDVVGTCMILHNMMVAHRMDNDEEEAADFYLQNPYERQYTTDGHEQEQEQAGG